MKLNYRKSGSGFPTLILHGVFGSSDNWQTVGKALADQFEVFLVDLRNHGQSPHSDEMNYQVMVQDVQELLNEQSLSQVNLVGHSMGGKVAMQFATKFPKLVSKLVVVDIAPKYYPPHHQDILAAFESLDIKNLKSRKEADEALEEQIKSFTVRQFILKNLGRNDQNEFEWKINHKAIRDNAEQIGIGLDQDQKYDGDTLFIRGDKSDYIQDADFQLISKHFPKVEIQSIIGAGHWVHAEKPAETEHTIREFLS